MTSQPPSSPWTPRGRRTSSTGRWERLQGLSESRTLIPTGLAQWFPIWGSLGEPSKDFWPRGLVEGETPGYLQPLEIPDGHCTLTEGQATTGSKRHHLSLLRMGLHQPTVLLQTLQWELHSIMDVLDRPKLRKLLLLTQRQFSCWANMGPGANESRRKFSGGDGERNQLLFSLKWIERWRQPQRAGLSHPVSQVFTRCSHATLSTEADHDVWAPVRRKPATGNLEFLVETGNKTSRWALRAASTPLCTFLPISACPSARLGLGWCFPCSFEADPSPPSLPPPPHTHRRC